MLLDYKRKTNKQSLSSEAMNISVEAVIPSQSIYWGLRINLMFPSLPSKDASKNMAAKLA